jgi:aryl sulfotransferase
MARSVIVRPVEREYREVLFDSRRWQGFTSHAGDIFVCTPPKCGTTWMQAIVAGLLFPDGAPGRVWDVSPWLEARARPIDEVLARLDAQTHRRCIKTHTPADLIPRSRSTSYVVVGRDGRDACMSFWNHWRNMRPELLDHLQTTAVADGIEASLLPVDDIHEFFAGWLDEQPLWFEHVASFWEHRGAANVLFVHYNDLQADLDREMRRVAGFLGVSVDEERWPALVESCTFAAMKQRSDDIANFDRSFIGGADSFLYKATNGRWRDVLTDDELAAFDRRCQELLPPDAIAWTVGGEAALTQQRDPDSVTSA